jgi:hypothetical protein
MLDSNYVYPSFDSVDAILKPITSMWAVYARAGLWCYAKNYLRTDSIMQTTDSLAALYGASTEEKSDYQTLWAAIKSAVNDSRSMYNLNELERATFDISNYNLYDHNNAREIMSTVSTMYATTSWYFMIPCSVYESSRGINNHNNPTDENIVTNGLFNAYPNPASGNVTFSYNQLKEAGIDLYVTNIIGERVFEQHNNTSSGLIQWDTHTNSPGIYLYKAIGKNGIISTGKIVVIK